MEPLIQSYARENGGITRLAAQLGVKHQSIYAWRKVPAERVLDVERVTGISRHDLRPDIYGPHPERASAR